MIIDFLSELTPERYPTIDFIKGMYDTDAIPAYSNAVQRQRAQTLKLSKLFTSTLTEEQLKMYSTLCDLDNEIAYSEENERFIAGFKLATRLIMEGLK